MEKTSDFFKKIGDIKGIFHAKMGIIKDRNGMDLTEAEDIEMRWQEHTGELYKKVLMTCITMVVWATHLKSNILECEVKGAVGSIAMKKTSGGDEIPVELLQILKDDTVKMMCSICQQIWKMQQ